MIAPALGYRPDRHKHSSETLDWKFAEHAKHLPLRAPASSGSWRDAGFVKIFNQLSLGTCVPHGFGGAWLALAIYLGLPDPEEPSFLGLYRGRALEGSLGWDSGMQIRDVFDWARRMGVGRQRLWPYTDDPTIVDGAPKWNHDPPDGYDTAALEKSATHDGIRYARIYETGDQRLEQLDQADAAGLPVVFGSSVSDQFCACSFDATKPFDPTTGTSRGLHCQWIVPGGRRFEPGGSVSRLVANSWGTQVLDGGFWRMSEAASARGLIDVHSLLAIPSW